jgi:hypothetical protein
MELHLKNYEKDRNYVDLLRNESSDEAEYFSE